MVTMYCCALALAVVILPSHANCLTMFARPGATGAHHGRKGDVSSLGQGASFQSIRSSANADSPNISNHHNWLLSPEPPIRSTPSFVFVLGSTDLVEMLEAYYDDGLFVKCYSLTEGFVREAYTAFSQS